MYNFCHYKKLMKINLLGYTDLRGYDSTMHVEGKENELLRHFHYTQDRQWILLLLQCLKNIRYV